MTTVSYICAVIFTGTLAASFRKDADPFSPQRCFVLTWSAAVGLADLKLSQFQHQWSTYSWTVLLLGIGSTLLGMYLVQVQKLGRPILSVPEIRRRIKAESFNHRILFRSIVVLVLAYSFAFVTESLIVGYLPIFSERPDTARIEFGLFGFHLIVNTMPIILLLMVEYLVIGKAARPRQFAVIGMALLVAGSFFMVLQRFDFFSAGLMIVPLLYYSGDYLRPRRLIISAALFLGFLYVIQSLRMTAYVENYIYIVSKVRYGPTYAALTEPYMYIVMNLENFTKGVDKLLHFNYGYFTGDFILAVTGLKHWMADYFSLVDRPFLVSGFNTYPFFWTYYHDFGLVGIFFLPLLLGYGIAALYYSLRERPSVAGIGLYSIAVFVLTISFFTNPLTMLKTDVNIVIYIFIHRLCTGGTKRVLPKDA